MLELILLIVGESEYFFLSSSQVQSCYFFSANRRTLHSNISDVLSDPGIALLKQHNLSRTLDPSKPAQISFAENETAKSDHQKMVASIRERNQRLQKMNTELENELRTLVEDRVQTGS